jgi:ribosome biogenesis GTPase
LFDDDTLAIIQDILPRKSLLKRKAAGKKIDYQLIAANIDIAIIMQALDSNLPGRQAGFNLRRLERYLVIINDNNITPLILLSKSDLISPVEVEEKKKQILEKSSDVKSNILIKFDN